mgnify:CR=1 FL=1
MQEHTIKTTLTFSPGFLQRLRTYAQQSRRSMSRIVEDEVDTAFKERERQRLDKMYQAIEKYMGSGSPEITDASQTIDETLYGENGAWKGHRDE